MIERRYNSIDELKDIPDKDLRNILAEHSDFAKLLDEYDGKFSCYYAINGCGLYLFNEVGGHINVYGDWNRISNNMDDIHIAQFFALRILKLKLQKD